MSSLSEEVPRVTDTSSSANPTPAPDRNAFSCRLFWVGMTAFLTLMVFLGFGSTYGRQLVFGLEISGAGIVATDWVIHLHATVFVGWMAFLLMQVVLIACGRTRTHMTLGGYGGSALGAAVLLGGGLIAYVQARTGVSEGMITWSEAPFFFPETWTSLLGFAVLFGLGILNRTRPEVHKRYMVFATIALVLAATSRMDYLLGPWSNSIGMGLMVAPILGYDLYTEKRVRSASLLGTGVMAALLAVEFL